MKKDIYKLSCTTCGYIAPYCGKILDELAGLKFYCGTREYYAEKEKRELARQSEGARANERALWSREWHARQSDKP